MRLTNKKKFNAIFSEIEKKTEAFLSEINSKVEAVLGSEKVWYEIEIQLLKTGDIWQRKELYEVYLLIQKVGVAYYKVHKPISIKLNYPEAATLYAMLQSTGGGKCKLTFA